MNQTPLLIRTQPTIADFMKRLKMRSESAFRHMHIVHMCIFKNPITIGQNYNLDLKTALLKQLYNFFGIILHL